MKIWDKEKRKKYYAFAWEAFVELLKLFLIFSFVYCLWKPAYTEAILVLLIIWFIEWQGYASKMVKNHDINTLILNIKNLVVKKGDQENG